VNERGVKNTRRKKESKERKKNGKRGKEREKQTVWKQLLKMKVVRHEY
jgi:hypothetical protein